MNTSAKVLVSRQKRRKGNVYDPNCPSRGILDHVTSRWGSLVLMVLLGGTQRFSELVRCIGGVSEKMLAQSLKTLDADGFLIRTVYPTIPPKVEYSLTPSGRDAALHIQTLTNWVEDNVAAVLKHRSANPPPEVGFTAGLVQATKPHLPGRSSSRSQAGTSTQSAPGSSMSSHGLRPASPTSSCSRS